ncbi:MAG: response regulator transcription factor [Clostridia bacterium]
MANESILVIEDDEDIREVIQMYLLNQGYRVTTAEDGLEGMRLFQQASYDLIILDILLPHFDGLQIAREIRKDTGVPLLFLSCKNEPGDIITGLELGGDDYMTKPFHPDILVARVKALLRRNILPAEKQVMCFGELEIDLTKLDIRLYNEPITLTQKERDLLIFLASHPNQVFSFEELYAAVWGVGSYGDTRTVMVHISNIRKKIEPEGTSPLYIQTVRGIGYRWIGKQDQGLPS